MDDSSNFQRNFSIGEVELEPDAIYHKTEYRERRNHYAVFWSNRPYDGFDTDETRLSAYTALAPRFPKAVQNGRCTGFCCARLGADRRDAVPPDARARRRKTLCWGSAILKTRRTKNSPLPASSTNRAANDRQKYRTNEQFDAAMDALGTYWDELLSFTTSGTSTSAW